MKIRKMTKSENNESKIFVTRKQYKKLYKTLGSKIQYLPPFLHVISMDLEDVLGIVSRHPSDRIKVGCK